MNSLKYPLTNAQIELLKLFSTNMPDHEVRELRSLLSRYYAKKAVYEADNLWDAKNLTNEDMDNLLNEPS
jgi:hypothetical protein